MAHCPWSGCNKVVPATMWGCKHHWFRLPADIRAAIWKAYRADDMPAWRAAHQRALDYIASQPAGKKATATAKTPPLFTTGDSQ